MTTTDFTPAVGDVVVDWNGRSGSRVVIKRLTTTQIVASNGRDEMKYRRRDFRRIGQNSWGFSFLVPLTHPSWVAYEVAQKDDLLAAKITGLMVKLRRDHDQEAAAKALKLLQAHLEGGTA